MSDLTPETLAELRRLLDVNRGRYFHALPWHAWDRGIGYELHVGATCRDKMEPRGYCEGVNNGFRETFGAPEAELIVAAVNALPGLLDDADALRAELAHMTEARDNARAEAKRLTAIVEAVRALHQPKHYADADMRAIAPSLPAEVCGDCWGRGDSAVPWPCPTAHILDADAEYIRAANPYRQTEGTRA